MSVHEGIRKVIADLSHAGIAKSRMNKQQGFSFRGIDDIYHALAPLLAKHELIIVPTVIQSATSERQTRTGGALFHVRMRVKYKLISTVDGSSVKSIIDSEAMDSGDKCVSKALSMAYKSMALQVFCIPVEGNEDADATSHEVSSMMSSELLSKLAEQVKQTGGDASKWQAYLDATYPDGVPHAAHASLVKGIERAAENRAKKQAADLAAASNHDDTSGEAHE